MIGDPLACPHWTADCDPLAGLVIPPRINGRRFSGCASMDRRENLSAEYAMKGKVTQCWH